MGIRAIIAVRARLLGLGIEIACSEDAVEIVASVDGWAALASVCTPGSADVVLLDRRLLGVDPEPFLGALAPACKIVVLLDDETPDFLPLLGAGVTGVVSGTTDSADLVATLRRAALGHIAIAPGLSPVLRGTEAPSAGARSRPRLTERERAVLARVAAGDSTDVIAAVMHLGESTVKTHLRNINEKLETTSRPAAVGKAIRLGLLD